MARGPRYASRCEGARPQAPPLPQSPRDATLTDTMAAFKFVFLPPQSDTVRQWAATLSGKVPQMEVSLPNRDDAGREIANADAAFGTLSADLLARADKLRWLQAPAIAPPAGYYFPELVAHPVVVTNFRGIFNEHIAAHIMAFVLAFARGLHYYIPQQLRHEWQPTQLDTGVVHLPESTALIVGVGGIGAEAAKLCTAFGMRVIGLDARREDQPEGVREMHAPSELDAGLQRAAFAIRTMPLTPAT